MDYECTRSIFEHFYGREANFQGYITKFLSCYPFYYSLGKLAIEKLYSIIERYCKLTEGEIRNMEVDIHVRLNDLLNTKSVRNIATALDGLTGDKRQLTSKIIQTKNLRITTDIPLLWFIALLKRLAVDFDKRSLISSIKDLPSKKILHMVGALLLKYDEIKENVCYQWHDLSFSIEIKKDEYGISRCEFINGYGTLSSINFDNVISKAVADAFSHVRDL
jgi:hypothetical protein